MTPSASTSASSPGLAEVGRSASTTRACTNGTRLARSDSARSCNACAAMTYSTAMSVRTGRPWMARQTFAGVSGMSA